MGAARSKKAKRTSAKAKKTPAFSRLVEIFTNQYKNQDAIIVVILGAGASYCSGMPPWSDLKEEILETAKGCYDKPEQFIEDTLERISAITGNEIPSQKLTNLEAELMKIASVELICSVACESGIVAKKIQELFIDKYGSKKYKTGSPPQLGYELLAHFLKHKFVDHFITFNFDEVLDMALDNELGPDEYDLIHSDQQILPNREPLKPRLIKLHGSISAPQTLRFKRDNTGVLPQELINLLDNTLSLSHFGQDSGKEKKKIHLISLGYSWRDWDFALWVKSRIEHISSITIVQRGNKESEQVKNLKQSKTEINVISTRDLSIQPGDKDSVGVLSIDQLLWALWNKLENKLNRKGLQHIPVSRHLILGHLFGPSVDTYGFVSRDFLVKREPLNLHEPKQRFTAEILLHLFKCKGMVNASVMAFDPRLNRYYQIYKDYKKSKSPLDESKDLIQSPYADVKETYFANAKNIAELIDGFIKHDQFVRKSTVFIPKYIENTANEKIELKATGQNTFIKEHLKKIYNGPEVEIVPKLDVRAHWLFHSPKPIANYLAVQKETSSLLKNDWSHLYIIAETGAWLFQGKLFNKLLKLKRRKGDRKRTIFLIRTSNEGTKKWSLRKEIVKELGKQEKKLRKSINLFKAELPWWEHNRHLTLAYNEEEKMFHKGIYFRRRLKTSRISPILVDDEHDCIELYFTFLSYFWRAINLSLKPKYIGFKKDLRKVGIKMNFGKNFKRRQGNLFDKIM